MNKISIIWGVTGQDGSYLAEHLIDKGHTVIGVTRRTSTDNTERISHITGLDLIEGDITDFSSVSGIICDYMPDEIYNLAAMSHVHTSFNQPILSIETNTIGVLNILEAIRQFSPGSRFIQASTSEMFGNNYNNKNGELVQNEDTPFDPVSPYAISKLAAHQFCKLYRNAYHLHVSTVLMYNHESPRRGENFVTRKITKWIGQFKNYEHYVKVNDLNGHNRVSKLDKLQLGNLDSSRDWSHAKDFVRALYLILRQENADEYILCSNETHTIRQFLDEAFAVADIYNWENYVEVNKSLYRPIDVVHLHGDSTKSRKKLSWHPHYTFKELVKDMVISDIDRYKT